MDISRPPHFDGTNFPYYRARMACYLEAVDLGVWRVTQDGMKPIKNLDKPTKSGEKEIHFNARAKMWQNLLSYRTHMHLSLSDDL